jgi:cobaltochelatase CobN
VFYRALFQAGDLAAVGALADALDRQGLDPHPVFVASLKDPAAAAFVRAELAAARPDVIVNLTGFAVGDGDPLAAADRPVLQAVLAASDVESWRAGTRGLAPRDVAMAVALPELDGRVMTRAIAFKGLRRRDEAVEADIVGSLPEPGRVAFVAALAAAWVRLRRAPVAERRVALVLSNYPTRDGRLANGVGLDTPASVVAILDALAAAGYQVAGTPADGAALMAALAAGPTNSAEGRARPGGVRYGIFEYREFLVTLPAALRAAVDARWGPPEADPRLDGDEFRLAVLEFGNVVVALQPARGYDVDHAASAHDPALVPPHGYLAFHAWLRRGFGAHAIVHVGKHGNLEWLPGKSIALDATCFPRRRSGPRRISTRSSSMTPARARRPSAAPPPWSSTT